MIALQPLNKMLILRRALGSDVALLVALLCDHYYADTQYLWIPLITVLILLVSYDADIKQILQTFLIVVLSVLISAFISKKIHSISSLFIVATTCFILCCLLEQIFYSFLFMPVACVFMLLVSPMYGDADFYALMHDVIVGGVIGVVARSLFFSGTLVTDFRQRAVLLLNGYSNYLSAIGDVMLQQPEAPERCAQQKVVVETLLQTEFPHWVYQRGFSPMLQQGHRHFLVRLEQIGEILFAMNYAVRKPVTPDLLAELQNAIAQSIEGVKSIIAALVVRLDTENFDKPVSDLNTEIEQLESKYREFINLPLELLDTSPDALTLTLFTYGLKDLQKNLIKIAEALRK
jgi:uncharacterized membrane protein YccC